MFRELRVFAGNKVIAISSYSCTFCSQSKEIFPSSLCINLPSTIYCGAHCKIQYTDHMTVTKLCCIKCRWLSFPYNKHQACMQKLKLDNTAAGATISSPQISLFHSPATVSRDVASWLPCTCSGWRQHSWAPLCLPPALPHSQEQQWTPLLQAGYRNLQCMGEGEKDTSKQLDCNQN